MEFLKGDNDFKEEMVKKCQKHKKDMTELEDIIKEKLV